MKILTKKSATFFFLLLVVSIMLLSSLGVAFAETSGSAFDETNVLEDLMSSSVNGVKFDYRDYPANDKGAVQLLSVVEYCYSEVPSKRKDYGLYIYVYNPARIRFDSTSAQNQIQLATAYNAENVPTSYEKFALKFCNKSANEFANLFWKFKVVDRRSVYDNKKIVDRVDSAARQYDISGFELKEQGARNAVDYKVGGTYTFTGFARGCGANQSDISTLDCKINRLETIVIDDLQHGVFRTDTSSLGKNHQNQLDSVFFTVPERFFTEYGKLQKIKASWYEYKTVPMFFTSDSSVYDGMYAVRGQRILSEDYNDISIPYWWAFNMTSNIISGTTWEIADMAFNRSTLSSFDHRVTIRQSLRQMPWVFQAELTNDVWATGSQLMDYAYAYDSSAIDGTLHNGLSADLFTDAVDSGRTKGFQIKEIDSRDQFDMLSYMSNHSWFEKVFDYFGVSQKDLSDDYTNISPIEVFHGLQSPIPNDANAALLDTDSYVNLRDMWTNTVLGTSRVVLFRFAQTDYYSGYLGGQHRPNNVFESDYYAKDEKVAFAQETVFFDFDIIELTFNKAGEYRVIPVVSSPIDIVGNVTKPFEPPKSDWWKWALAILLLVVVLLIFHQPIFWLLSLPFKLIGVMIGSARQKKRDKNYEKKE